MALDDWMVRGQAERAKRSRLALVLGGCIGLGAVGAAWIYLDSPPYRVHDASLHDAVENELYFGSVQAKQGGRLESAPLDRDIEIKRLWSDRRLFGPFAARRANLQVTFEYVAGDGSERKEARCIAFDRTRGDTLGVAVAGGLQPMAACRKALPTMTAHAG